MNASGGAAMVTLAETAATTGATGAGGMDLGTGVVLMAVGMGVVFVALTLLMGVVALLNRVFDRGGAVAEAGGAGSAGASVEDGVPPEIVAVLTAAAVTAMGGGARVRRISRADGGDAWTSGGRGRLMGSHRLPRT